MYYVKHVIPQWMGTCRETQDPFANLGIMQTVRSNYKIIDPINRRMLFIVFYTGYLCVITELNLHGNDKQSTWNILPFNRRFFISSKSRRRYRLIIISVRWVIIGRPPRLCRWIYIRTPDIAQLSNSGLQSTLPRYWFFCRRRKSTFLHCESSATTVRPPERSERGEIAEGETRGNKSQAREMSVRRDAMPPDVDFSRERPSNFADTRDIYK